MATQILTSQPLLVAEPSDIDAAIDAHRADPAPHPVYDDMPDLTLIFENGLT